jgi:hypothetical protein
MAFGRHFAELSLGLPEAKFKRSFAPLPNHYASGYRACGVR